MKKDSFFFRAALALCLMLGSASVWSQTVIAGWTFPNNSSSTRIFDAQCGYYSGTSQIFANGDNGSSDWNGDTPILNYDYLNYPTGDSNPTDFCQQSTGNRALSFYSGYFGNRNNFSIVFKISTLDFKNLKLRYRIKKEDESFTTHSFAYSTNNGTSFTNISGNVTSLPNTYGTIAKDLSSVPSTNNLLIKLTFSGAGNGIVGGRTDLDNVLFTADPNVTTWSGSSWDKGTPGPGSIANIDGVYTTGTDRPSITAATVNINSTLEITDGYGLLAPFVEVNDGGNFIEQDGSAVSIGNLTLNKGTTGQAPRYKFWSSPVENQNMYDIYNVGTPQFVMYMNTPTNTYINMPYAEAESVPGKGYSVKIPAGGTAVSFSGLPNKGNINLTLDNTGSRWNLIGNPYPSNLNMTTLYAQNSTAIESTMYLWNNMAPNNVQHASNGSEWNIFNAASGTWSAYDTFITNDMKSVEAGQGFIVRANQTSLIFKNSMRNADVSVFLNKAVSNGAEGKFWLKLTTPGGVGHQTAITYGQEASNLFDHFDSKKMGVDANDMYTYDGTNKMAIQGRDYFVNTDVVTVGNKHSAAGQYTISLAGTTGLFAAGQAIYLRDKQTGIYTNLQTDNYTFTTDALEQQNRFEVVYMPQGALGTAETVKGETVVYKDGEHFTVKADEKILSIEVYDAAGRLTEVLKPNRNQTEVFLKSKGVYLLKIKTVTGETTKKILK